MYEASQVLKTWCNSWSTSYRYHEGTRLPCLLGCADKPDNQIHYASCPRMMELTRGVFENVFNAESYKRLGIYAKSPVELQIHACVYVAYHAVKREFRESGTIRYRIPTPPSGLAPAGGIETTTFHVDRDLAAKTFVDALRAAAFIAGIPVSLHEPTSRVAQPSIGPAQNQRIPIQYGCAPDARLSGPGV